jgi:hypothetical protein
MVPRESTPKVPTEQLNKVALKGSLQIPVTVIRARRALSCIKHLTLLERVVSKEFQASRTNGTNADAL